MSSTMYELAVVGGGPVGLYTAIRAAEEGLSVALVEPRTAPIDKACGEGLMPSAIELLLRAEVDPPGACFDGISYLQADGRRRVHGKFRSAKGRGVRRTRLQKVLVERAQHLSVERFATSASDLSQGPNSVAVKLGNNTEIEARFIAGADGLHSRVRGFIGATSSTTGHTRFGLSQHFRQDPWTTSVEVHWAGGAEAYVTPVSDHEVGVAILGERSGGSFTERLLEFPYLMEKLTGAEPTSDPLGAGPLKQTVNRQVNGRVLLVGDAAGYVDALTGEGLAVGFASADALVRAVARGRPDGYAREWQRITRRYRWSTNTLLAATRHRLLRKALIPVASTVPSVFAAAVNRLG